MKMKNIFLIIIIALLLRVVYVLFYVGVESYRGNKKSFSYETVIEVFKRNDAFWYEKIAINGYSSVDQNELIGFNKGSEFTQSEWAFFPFYPILIYITKVSTGLSINTSMLLLSIFFSVLGFAMFYVFTYALYGDSSKSLFYVLLLLIFPFHYYFSVFYTEAIFVSVLICSFYAIIKRRYLLMSFLIIFLVLTRPNGIILLIPLYLFMLEREGVLVRLKLNFKAIIDKRNVIRTLYFCSGVVAFIVYGAYQQYMTGEFFAFSIAQKGWYRDFMFPFLAFFRHGDLASQFDSVYTIMFILLAIASWKLLPISFNILIWISLLLPLTSGSVLSMPRFISIIFPFIIIIGNYMYRIKFKWGIAGILFILQLISFYFWVDGNPLGY
jgi:Gpi18-like mannosyltransferase